ncbi:MAG: hypothetical protein J6Q06_03920, partial [Clostridia bacterium]|nr:hypothetical protein [Clostridia bacterium]
MQIYTHSAKGYCKGGKGNSKPLVTDHSRLSHASRHFNECKQYAFDCIWQIVKKWKQGNSVNNKPKQDNITAHSK